MIIRAAVHEPRLHPLDQTLIGPVESAYATHETPFILSLSLRPYRRAAAVRAWGRVRRQHRIKGREHPPGRLRPAEMARTLEARRAHLALERRRAGDLEQRLRQVWLAVRVDEASGCSCDLGARAGVGYDGRTPRGERLEDGQAKALTERCEHEAIGKLVGGMQPLVGHEPDEMHAFEVGRAEPAGEEVLFDTPAGDDQRQRLRSTLAVLPIGAHEALVVAPGIVRQTLVPGVQHACDREDETLGKAMLAAKLLQLAAVAFRGEARTDTGVSHDRAGELQPMADELIERCLRDREDRPRLATVKRQHGTDVNVVPPGIVPRIDVPVAALEDEDSGDAAEEGE